MLLTIDVGNTNTLFALHDGERWVAQWRSATDSTKTADDYAVWMSELCRLEGIEFGSIEACVISTVVPQAQFNFRNFSRRYLNQEPMFIGEAGVELGIPNRYARPEQVGADRLVNAIGAHLNHPGPLIVVDSGTATTFDIVGEDGGFEGGIIAPGINLSLKALHDAAASLPRIAIQRPDKVIATNTVSSMQAGIFLGYVDLIDGLIRRIKAEYAEPLTVVGTGGVASLFEGASEEIDVFDSDVTIRGLLEVYKRNTSPA